MLSKLNPTCTSSYAGTGSHSPSLVQIQSPNTNLLTNQSSIFNLNPYRNKLKHHRSSCCVINTNPLSFNQQLEVNSNTQSNNQLNDVNISSLSSSICSSLSPSPITILSQNSQNYILATPPPSNTNFGPHSTLSVRSTLQPSASRLQLTPASSSSFTQSKCLTFLFYF